MKFISTFLFCCIFLQFGFSQEHSYLFQTETIKKNRIRKVLEYHPDDSLHFFEQFPEGYYSKYDRSGRMIESCHYSPYEHNGIYFSNLFVNYYIYDSLGKQIGFISKYDNENSEQPFRSITLTSSNKIGDSVTMVSLTREYKPSFDFTRELVKEKEPYFGDTIAIGKRHKRFISNEDSLISKDLYFNKQGLKDSMIFCGNGYTYNDGKKIPHTTRNVTHYSYFKDGTLKSAVKKNFQTTNGVTKLDSEEVYRFLENGLLDTLKNTSYWNNEPTINFSKFRYTFWEE